MNYEEFENIVLADPYAESDALSAFEAANPDARELRRKARLLDQQMSAAMAVPVPAAVEQADPTADSNIVSIPRPARLPAPVWLAAAACLAIVALMIVRPPVTAPATDGIALANTIVEHIAHELGEMRPGLPAVAESRLDTVLTAASTRLDDTAPLVSYARTCPVNGRQVPHLVMQGERGPVTVLLLPDERVDGPVSIMRDGLEGVILPVGDSGSIAIIGRDIGSVDAVRDQALSSVGFSI